MVEFEGLPPTESLVAYWPADGNANDAVAGNNGTLQGGATFAPGILGQAFSFDGLDDSVSVSDDTHTLGGGSFTIALWANFNKVTERDPFISHSEGSEEVNKWILWLDARGHDKPPGPALRFHINSPSIPPLDTVLARWEPKPGEWYHVAATRSSQTYALYIDGVQVATSIDSNTIPDPDARLTIGQTQDTNFFDGLIDEVRIYNRALSASEIRAIYDAVNRTPAPAAATAPTPSATATPIPTSTPIPPPTRTPTPIPVPTERPAPAPAPTRTPEPTPMPTRTPVPVPEVAAPTTGTCYIVGQLVSDCPPRSPHTWKSPPEVLGEYWCYHCYDGPRPTTWYESPMSYQLVKAGLLPPLNERVPPPEDRGIVQGPSGIGWYGGTYRQTGTQQYLGEWIVGSWAIRDSNGADWHPWIGKAWQISDDGRTYTMTLRRNLHWSDGSPYSMEDIRFAWEDSNFNKELNKTVSVEFRDPVTDNVVDFAIIDDLRWTLTYDTPVYNLFELRSTPSSWCAKGSFAYHCPPYMKQFHPKYADPAELQAMIDDANLEDWTQLFSRKTNVISNPDKPCLVAWCTKIKEDTQIIAERNHYYAFFDPEGNQLPYAGQATKLQMESREVAVFRNMAGETDGMTTPFLVPELPLYNANMERGDYSIYHWPSTGGSDLVLNLNMEYNKDREVGRWIRTKDFRLALSLAMDREVLNENIFLGIGTIQNWAPHPSTPYYPGAEVAQRYVQYDPARANEILDSLGLTLSPNPPKDGLGDSP